MHGGTAASLHASELQRPGFGPTFNLELLLVSVQRFTGSPRVYVGFFQLAPPPKNINKYKCVCPL